MKRFKMAPEIRAYIKRVDDFVAGRDPITLLKTAPTKYAKALQGLTDAQLNRRPAPRKWSIKEILGHVADSEIVYGYRYRKALGEPGSPIQGYDQDKWSDALRYRRQPVGPLLAKYKVLREDHLGMLRRATPSERKRHGFHSERGPESVERIAYLLAGHNLNHLEQIHNIKKKFGWMKKSGQQRTYRAAGRKQRRP